MKKIKNRALRAIYDRYSAQTFCRRNLVQLGLIQRRVKHSHTTVRHTRQIRLPEPEEGAKAIIVKKTKKKRRTIARIAILFYRVPLTFVRNVARL